MEKPVLDGRGTFPCEWVSDYAPRPDAKSRLVLFHHAGGGASTYRTWRFICPEDMELVPIQMPGRENRFREPAYESAEGLGTILAQAISPLFDRPVALFGHSLGAMLAFEVAYSLEHMSLSIGHLFVSSRWPPHSPSGREPMHPLPKEEFRRRLGEFGGTPAMILENDELMSLFEPYLRADLKMNETYMCHRTVPLKCPITAFAAENDSLVPPRGIQDWSRWTSSRFEMEIVPGNHFHFRSDPGRIVQSILSRFP